MMALQVPMHWITVCGGRTSRSLAPSVLAVPAESVLARAVIEEHRGWGGLRGLNRTSHRRKVQCSNGTAHMTYLVRSELHHGSYLVLPRPSMFGAMHGACTNGASASVSENSMQYVKQLHACMYAIHSLTQTRKYRDGAEGPDPSKFACAGRRAHGHGAHSALS